MSNKQVIALIVILAVTGGICSGIAGRWAYKKGVAQGVKASCPLTPDSREFLHAATLDLPEEFTAIKPTDPVAIITLSDTTYIIPRKFESTFEEGSDGYIADVVHFIHPEFTAGQVEDYIFKNE